MVKRNQYLTSQKVGDRWYNYLRSLIFYEHTDPHHQRSTGVHGSRIRTNV